MHTVWELVVVVYSDELVGVLAPLTLTTLLIMMTIIRTHKLLLFLAGFIISSGWLGSRVVSVLDLGAVGPGFKSQSLTLSVLGKLFTPIVPLFTKQQNC